MARPLSAVAVLLLGALEAASAQGGEPRQVALLDYGSAREVCPELPESQCLQGDCVTTTATTQSSTGTTLTTTSTGTTTGTSTGTSVSTTSTTVTSATATGTTLTTTSTTATSVTATGTTQTTTSTTQTSVSTTSTTATSVTTTSTSATSVTATGTTLTTTSTMATSVTATGTTQTTTSTSQTSVSTTSTTATSVTTTSTTATSVTATGTTLTTTSTTATSVTATGTTQTSITTTGTTQTTTSTTATSVTTTGTTHTTTSTTATSVTTTGTTQTTTSTTATSVTTTSTTATSITATGTTQTVTSTTATSSSTSSATATGTTQTTTSTTATSVTTTSTTATSVTATSTTRTTTSSTSTGTTQTATTTTLTSITSTDTTQTTTSTTALTCVWLGCCNAATRGVCHSYQVLEEEKDLIQEVWVPSRGDACSNALGADRMIVSSACLCAVEAFQDLASDAGIVKGYVRFGPLQLSPWRFGPVLSGADDEVAGGEQDLIEAAERHVQRYDIYLVGSEGEIGGDALVAAVPVRSAEPEWNGCCQSAFYSAEVEVNVTAYATVRFLVVPVTILNTALPGRIVEGIDCCSPTSTSTLDGELDETVITMTQELIVDEPDVFCSTPEVVEAAAVAMANLTGMDENYVSAACVDEQGSRRLSAHGRRMAGEVTIEYSFRIPAGSTEGAPSAASVKAALEDVSLADVTAAINAELQGTGVTVEVIAVSAPEVSFRTRTSTTSTAAIGTESSGADTPSDFPVFLVLFFVLLAAGIVGGVAGYWWYSKQPAAPEMPGQPQQQQPLHPPADEGTGAAAVQADTSQAPAGEEGVDEEVPGQTNETWV